MLSLPVKPKSCGTKPLVALAGIILTSIGVAAGAPVPARAQGVFDMGALTNTLSQDANTQSERRRALRGGRKRSPRTVSNKTTQAAYTPSPAVRKRSIATFLNGLRKTDPAYATELEKVFATTDVFGLWSKKLAPYGLKTNSVTDAFTIYMITAWHGVRGRNDDPNKTHTRGVHSQMAHVLAALPGVTKASDAKKQEMAESLLLQSLLIDTLVASAKKQPTLLPKTKLNILADTLAMTGLDLTTLKLTDKGLTR